MPSLHDSAHEFAGLRALVTGGTRGIGAGIAARLIAGGAQVVVTGRQPSDEAPDEAQFVAGDLTTPAGTRAVADAALAALGGVDILVNNAGGAEIFREGIAAIPDSAWEESLSLNLLAAVRMTNALLPALKAGNGSSVINISSVSATMTFPFAAPYGAAKAALDYYSRTLAIELGPVGVRVNVLSPGPISTPNADAQRQEFPMTPQDWQQAVPLGTMGTPGDIAEMVALLVSDRGRFITGANIPVDGGMTAR